MFCLAKGAGARCVTFDQALCMLMCSLHIFGSSADMSDVIVHSLHSLSADRLERILYDCGLQAPAQGGGRSRHT